MRSPLRYIRAFFRALILTLRGQKPPTVEAEERYASLLAWCKETMARLDSANAAIDQNSVETKLVVMHIEGRDVSLEHALSVVRYHAAREYPHLIRSGDHQTLTAIHALNLNDRFLITRLSEYEGLPTSVKTALDSLGEQLANIPKE
jgi:hypothetical protein